MMKRINTRREVVEEGERDDCDWEEEKNDDEEDDYDKEEEEEEGEKCKRRTY